MLRRIRDILIFALCLLLAMAPAVEANSAPAEWEGVEGVGTLVMDDDCPIVVDGETLTFDIQQLPDYYSNLEDMADYGASVTAEYTFRNPTDEDVTATLLFPYGQMPNYLGSHENAVSDGYGVWIDGEAVEVTDRASLHLFGGSFDMEEDLALLHSGYMEHGFYRPDMPVTAYVYWVSGVDHEAYPAAAAAMDVYGGGENRKILGVDFNGGENMDGFTRMTGFVDDRQSSADDLLVYVIGEPFEEQPKWTIFENGSWEKEIGGTVELVQTSTMTLRELALTEYEAKYGISEEDWYNAFVQQLEMNEWSDGCIGPDVGFQMARCTMRWFQYALTVPAGSTVVNRVTAPLYPTIHMGWQPYIYTYTYLLSPAKGWADFGTLDIRINTPYHMTQCDLQGFRETEEGYELHLEGLPDKELVFVLSESRNPAKPGTGERRMLWITGGLIVLAIGVVARRKRRKKK